MELEFIYFKKHYGRTFLYFIFLDSGNIHSQHFECYQLTVFVVKDKYVLMVCFKDESRFVRNWIQDETWLIEIDLNMERDA